ncbi:unnamed protein product [Sphenostylis stenocarpa]|uniref:Uncharacterized protein n=1 Tax=Sphenostylis stenocarpa TaxID=92480 RepID=A0AA86SBK9_9FABA|nr:unnamed protein product [Sphenostylis stenocarpa]
MACMRDGSGYFQLAVHWDKFKKLNQLFLRQLYAQKYDPNPKKHRKLGSFCFQLRPRFLTTRGSSVQLPPPLMPLVLRGEKPGESLFHLSEPFSHGITAVNESRER